jgi:hypothetical protein
VQGPGQVARAAAASPDQQEESKHGGHGGAANGSLGQHAVGNGLAANGVERVEVELLDGSTTDAKALGALTAE